MSGHTPAVVTPISVSGSWANGSYVHTGTNYEYIFYWQGNQNADSVPRGIKYNNSTRQWEDNGSAVPYTFDGVSATQTAQNPQTVTGYSSSGSAMWTFTNPYYDSNWSAPASSPWTVTTTSTPATGTQSHSYVQDSIRDVSCSKTAAYEHTWSFKHRDVSSAPYHSGMGQNAVTYTCKHWPGGGNTSTDIVQEAFPQGDGTYTIDILSNTTYPNAQIETGDVSTLHANINMQVSDANGNWSWVTAGDIIASFTYESTNVSVTVGAGYVGDVVQVVATDTNQYPDYSHDISFSYTLDNPPANHQGSATQLTASIFNSTGPHKLQSSNNYTLSGTWTVGDDGSSSPTGLSGTLYGWKKTPVPVQAQSVVLSRAYTLSPYGQNPNTRRRAHSFW